MNTSTLMGIMCLAILTGCGRQEPPATTPTPQKAPKSQAMPSIKAEPTAGTAAAPTAPPTATAADPGAATTAATAPETAAKPSEFATPEVVDVNLATLQEAVESYTRATKRKAVDLQQLVTEHYLTVVPPAPKGRRYVLDQATQTVKSVNK